jgi:hypothetical protein
MEKETYFLIGKEKYCPGHTCAMRKCQKRPTCMEKETYSQHKETYSQHKETYSQHKETYS